jgi:DNA topoisomerase-1
MAKKSGKKKKASKKKVSKKKVASGSKARKKTKGRSKATDKVPDATGKHLVIVESPAKARTINKYLGNDYVVLASVGHVRDLPSRAPKGVKQEVPGVDVDHNFEPTYAILPDKKKTVSQLKKAAKQASDIWFATDMDREGEAIAWHLAHALDVDPASAQRVVFNAITKTEILKAFSQPRHIDQAKVDAQQARRILDRIVGYQVSPLLWKKVAGGLSAGRVQSVAVRLVVEREREIDAFTPEEYWKITGVFATDASKTDPLAKAWSEFTERLAQEEGSKARKRTAWLSEHECLSAELIKYNGKPFKVDDRKMALNAAKDLGFALERREETDDPKGKGPAAKRCTFVGDLASADLPDFEISSIETKQSTTRPSAPFITSTLQQAAANQLHFSATGTMRTAQNLYEGVVIKSMGTVGLITYMRTDSTHISGEAITAVRNHIEQSFGPNYLPEKPKFYTSPNKAAQEAHEAIRPTDVSITPQIAKSSLNDQQFKLYQLIWNRFVASQMCPAKWDGTTILIDATPKNAKDDAPVGTFKSSGRKLVFDGFYRVSGVPKDGELVLPELQEKQAVGPIDLEPTQHFTNPPARYNEASLVKKLESEGIGRPSTYASIVQVIQNRRYVEKLGKAFYATDLGEVVTDKLSGAFPRIMDVGYTRDMETQLDQVEEEKTDWVKMLGAFYTPFKKNLEEAHEHMKHAKAEFKPAPYKCEKCGAATIYRFGRNGRFLSCGTYPDCDYAAPIDRAGNPVPDQMTNIICPICDKPMTKRRGRFGPFLGCQDYPTCKGIVNLDAKKGTIKLPKPPPLLTDLLCAKCDGQHNMRRSKRGPWLSCSRFPKCRGRMGWAAVEPEQQEELEIALAKHEADNPVPVIRTTDGSIVEEGMRPQVEGAAEEEQTVESDAA